MDAEEQRYEELKARWQALYKADDKEPEPDYDEDTGFAGLLDDFGGELDAVEDYLQGCERIMADPLVKETHDSAGVLKALGAEEAARLSPEGLRYWFERRVLWGSLCGALPYGIPSDPSEMSRDEMLAAVGEHPDIFAPKAETQDGSRGVH
jgi:hypothetical protein